MGRKLSTFGAFFAAVGAVLTLAGCPSKGDPKKSATQLDLAKDRLSRLDLDGAEHHAQKALAHFKGNAEAYNVLGLADYLRAVRNVQLLEVEDCLTGIDAEVLRKEVDKHLIDAAAHFEMATKIRPDYGEGYANRGAAAMQLDEFARAVAYFKRALELPASLDNPGLTRTNLGWAYFRSGAVPEAAKELLQARQFNPGMCLANYRLGRVYFDRKEWNKALEKFEEVAGTDDCKKVATLMQETHQYLMNTYAALGMNSKAQASRSACLSIAPKSCVARKCGAGPR